MDMNENLRCYCIEVNGHDSGVGGVQDVPKGQMDSTQKILAGLRAEVNPEMRRKYAIANEIMRASQSGEFNHSPEAREKIEAYMKKILRTEPTFKNAYKNPDFIEDITRDKWLQEKYIPKEYAPHTWHEGESTKSKTGWWIIKRRNSRGGDGVHVVSNKEFGASFTKEVDFIADFVAQEFIPSAGAEMMPESIGKRAASMRLLLDFRYLENWSVQTDFATAYQRVAPYTASQEKSASGTMLENEDKFIVNRHRDAVAVAASPEEIEMARTAAMEIIQNIAAGYRKHLKREKKT